MVYVSQVYYTKYSFDETLNIVFQLQYRFIVLGEWREDVEARQCCRDDSSTATMTARKAIKQSGATHDANASFVRSGGRPNMRVGQKLLASLRGIYSRTSSLRGGLYHWNKYLVAGGEPNLSTTWLDRPLGRHLLFGAMLPV